jgi:hypothetical protein
MKLIAIKDINFEGSPHCRYELNVDAVNEYCAAYALEEKLPPPTLYKTHKLGLVVCDGMHRLTAMQMAGIKQCLCNVVVGELESCFGAAVRENLHHGVRRTNADKRQCVETAIHLYPELADLKIAEICHVSHSTVAEVRKLLETSGTITKRETIKTSDGKSRPTSNVHKTSRLPKMHFRQSDSKQDSEHSLVLAAKDVCVASKGNGVAGATPVADATGYPIPERALAIWGRRDDVEGIIEVLRETKRTLAGYSAARDILMAEVNLNAADCELDSLISRLQAAVPYAVCPMCQGKLPENCTGCGKRGMVSRAKFERTDPALLKVRQMNASSKRLPK